MKFFTRVVPAVLAAVSLVHASALVPRTDDGIFSEYLDALNKHNLTILADNYKRIAGTASSSCLVFSHEASALVPRTDGGIFSEYLDALNKHNLTILADNYKRIAGTNRGKEIVDRIESGKEFTILAPEDCAFDSDDKSLDPRQIEYSTLFGNIDKHFSTKDYHRRASHEQSRGTAESTMTRSGASNGKRSESYLSPFQVQIIDRFRSFWKRWENDDLILIDRPVGAAKVVDRFSFKNLVILIIDTVLTLPPRVSELLRMPILKTAPKGLMRFGEALKKAGLQDLVDTKDAITIFAPVDECLDDIDKLSKTTSRIS
ncbi:hypothetical protein RSAG8_13190, partial [Rhizoctonia solani AG-8 WAC10335]